MAQSYYVIRTPSERLRVTVRSELVAAANERGGLVVGPFATLAEARKELRYRAESDRYIRTGGK